MSPLQVSFVGAALLASISRLAFAAPAIGGLTGTWSQNPACNGTGLAITFSQGRMDVLQDGERRTLVDVEMRSLPGNDVEVHTVAVEYVRQPNPNPPTPGDLLRFQFSGTALHLIAVTVNGKALPLPADGSLFYHCP